MLSKTTSYLRNLIVLEVVLCINRSYLLDCSTLTAICNIIWFTSLITTGAIFSYNLASENIVFGTKCFEVFMVIELLGLIMSGKIKCVSFETITKLDEKYGFDGKYFANIKGQVNKIIVTCAVTAILDIFGLSVLKCDEYLIVISCVIISAHESEMSFFALLLHCINMRLSHLFDVTPIFGSKIYRHVLVASSHLHEEFSLRMLLMYGVSIATTVVYAMLMILSESEMMTPLTVYLVWREIKTIYSMWLCCAAAARTEDICNKLTSHLAGRLMFDTRVSKDKNSSQYKTLVRWYKALLTQRPQYLSGSVLRMGLGAPLHLLDQSINYVLIIVQIYLAYR